MIQTSIECLSQILRDFNSLWYSRNIQCYHCFSSMRVLIEFPSSLLPPLSWLLPLSLLPHPPSLLSYFLSPLLPPSLSQFICIFLAITLQSPCLEAGQGVFCKDGHATMYFIPKAPLAMQYWPLPLRGTVSPPLKPRGSPVSASADRERQSDDAVGLLGLGHESRMASAWFSGVLDLG